MGLQPWGMGEVRCALKVAPDGCVHALVSIGLVARHRFAVNPTHTYLTVLSSTDVSALASGDVSLFL